MRGENYFTVPSSGEPPESADFEQKSRAAIESRYWCFVQYFVKLTAATARAPRSGRCGRRETTRRARDREPRTARARLRRLDGPRAPRERHVRPVDALLGAKAALRERVPEPRPRARPSASGGALGASHRIFDSGHTPTVSSVSSNGPTRSAARCARAVEPRGRELAQETPR